ncbi:AAA family ATPase [Dielma fastidiosa]|uniref:AAA family ATPase n=1 Tax=Dielma fastidiosa TaxID=1034346 RepID=UPI000D7AB1D9|nr:AAA family ATPase [Dielma fastidiosa]MBS6167120.1 AAA family ATPase [Bacillota bacterium]PWM53367.1 MAG: nucleotide kinase [Dielma fastidiosa]
MKKLYMIGGTMGVGKTAVCQLLKKQLNHCVFLDGDWCWDMHPFEVNEETKQMVLANIKFLLNSFIQCSVYENIIFCWVMHEQSIIDELLSAIETANCEVKVISLICREESLRERLQKDVDQGIREPEIIQRSIQRLDGYKTLNSIKLDVSDISASMAAKQIASL